LFVIFLSARTKFYFLFFVFLLCGREACQHVVCVGVFSHLDLWCIVPF